MKSKWFGIVLSMGIVIGVQAGSAAGKIAVYSHHVDPADHPNAAVRKFDPVTWDAVGDRMHFRDTGLYGTYERITVDNFLSDKRRPGTYAGLAERLADGSMKFFSVKSDGKLNFPPLHGVYYTPLPASEIEYMRTTYGSSFLGIDWSEDDQAYQQTSPYTEFPRSRRYEKRYVDFMNQFHIHELGADYTLRTVYDVMGWHYCGAHGQSVFLGNQGQARDNIGLAVGSSMIRGAGKQQGVLWAGKFANQMRWLDGASARGQKQESTAAFSEHWQEVFDAQSTLKKAKDSRYDEGQWKKARNYIGGSVEDGPSWSTLRTHLYSEYMRNCAAVGYECPSQIRGLKEEPENGSPSTFGYMLEHAESFMEANGLPGVLHAPAALLIDHFGGWMPPQAEKGKTEGDTFYTWAEMPYNMGDHLTHSLFDFLYTGYLNQGWYERQRYVHPANPHGEADALTTDAALAVMKQYNVIVAAGRLFSDIGFLRTKVDDYLAEGRTLVITADNARRLFEEWDIVLDATPVSGKVEFSGYDDAKIAETGDFELARAMNLPADSKTVATCGGKQAVVRVPHNGGEVVLLLSPYGLSSTIDPNFSLPLVQEGVWRTGAPIVMPYNLLGHVRHVLAHELDRLKLFNVTDDDELMRLVCRKGPSEYTIGIFNPTTNRRPYSISSNIGAITRIQELELHDRELLQLTDADKTPKFGFYARNYDHIVPGANTPGIIRPGDARIFRVFVKEDPARLEILPKASYPKRAQNRYVRLERFDRLRSQLLQWPSFFNNFSGVMVPGRMLLDMDDNHLKQESSWVNWQKVQILVAGTGLSTAELKTVIRKMAYFTGATNLVTSGRNDAGLLKQAAAAGITLHPGNSSATFEIVGPDTVPGRVNTAKPVVFNMVYDKWDDLFFDQALVFGPKAYTTNFMGRSPQQVEPSSQSTLRINANNYLTLRGVRDVKEYISEHPAFFDHFGGVKLESEDLRILSEARFIKDMKWLKARGIDVIVDLTSELDLIENISFLPDHPHYQHGQQMLSSTFGRMKQVGLTQAVMTSLGPWWGGTKLMSFKELVDGITKLTKQAQTHGVEMYFRPFDRRRQDTIADIDKLIEKNNIPNLHAAVNMTTVGNLPTDSQLEDPGIKLVFLGVAGDYVGTMSLPISQLEQSESDVQRTKQILNNPALADKQLIFDTEYLDWTEVEADVKYVAGFVSPKPELN